MDVLSSAAPGTSDSPSAQGRTAEMLPPTASAASAGHAVSLERLAEAFGMVRRLCPLLPALAIRWLHLKHPLKPAQEALLRGEGWERRSAAAGSGIIGWLRSAIRGALYAGSLSVRLARLRWALRRELGALRRQSFEVIAKTCCIRLEPSPEGDDFYYGNLQERLQRRGVRTLLLCGDIFDGNWREFSARHLSLSVPCRLPELCLVRPSVPARLAWQQLVSSWRLWRLARSHPDPLVRAAAGRAALDCWLPDTAWAALTYWIAREAVAVWRPRAFLTFYEGHAWERCAWWGAKDADGSCLTVGYQHGMVFRESLALTRPAVDVRARSVPDVVLGLGDIPLELMRPGHQGHGVRMLPFGSFRYRDAAATGPADCARRTVLVTPEGHEPECSALFAFAAACASRLPSYTFIFRMQPGVPLPGVAASIAGYQARCPNIILSGEPDIAGDCARSSILLYRGSSTVVYAALNGLLPVYAHVDALVDTDPLYALAQWRRVCAGPEEFAALARELEAMSDERRASEWRAAVSYLGRYVGPVQERSIERLMDAMGCSKRTCGDADGGAGP